LVTQELSFLSLWNAQTGEHLARFDHSRYPSQFPQFSPDGTLLAWVGSDGAAHLWNIATNAELAALPSGRYHYGATFSPDGTLLATTDGNGEGTLWDVASLQQRAHFCSSGNVMLFSPDSSIIITFNTEYHHGHPDACIADTSTGETLASLTSDIGGNRVQFSPDGSKLFYYGWTNQVPLQVWDVSTRQLLQLPIELTNNVVYARFGPDSSWFIVWQTNSTGNITATAIDMATWSTLNVLIQGNSPQFSPDGTILVTRQDDLILVYGIPSN
jgi:WD40 repeat protein